MWRKGNKQGLIFIAEYKMRSGMKNKTKINKSYAKNMHDLHLI